MKIADIRKKDDKGLAKEATKLREAIAEANRDRVSTDDKNVRKGRNLRKDLARVLSVQSERSDDSAAPAAKEDKTTNDKEDTK